MDVEMPVVDKLVRDKVFTRWWIAQHRLHMALVTEDLPSSFPERTPYQVTVAAAREYLAAYDEWRALA